MRVLRVVLIACLAAPQLWSGRLNGTWRAELAGRRGSIIALKMALKDDDGIVTGTVRGSRGPEPISSGAIDGDSITFTVVTEFHGEQIHQRYRGTMDGDVIHFEITEEDGRDSDHAARDFDAERSPDDPASDEDPLST